MSAEKHVRITQNYAGWTAYGVSVWDIQIPGSRLRTETMRSTRLDTPAAVRKWGRRHKLDVEREAADLEAKQAQP